MWNELYALKFTRPNNMSNIQRIKMQINPRIS